MQVEGAASVSVSLGDGATCNPAGCCAHSTRGIRRGLCIWREHCCVLAAALVGWVKGNGSGSLTSFLLGIPPSHQPAVPGPLCTGCAGEGLSPLREMEAASATCGALLKERQAAGMVDSCALGK